MENIEIWKDVPNYEGLYQVSNLGNVKSLSRIVARKNNSQSLTKEKLLKQNIVKGYLRVYLYKDCLTIVYSVHKLVAIAFLNHKPCGHKLVVNHINFDKKDNRLENLEIVTQRENANLKRFLSTSKYTGVSWSKIAKKWRADIWIDRKLRYLGCFNNEIDAHNAYQNKLKEILTKTL